MADRISERACRDAINELRRQCFAPWIKANPIDFVRNRVRMLDEHGATKPWDFDFFPPQREMFEEIFNPANRKVVYKIASRLTKTMTVLGALSYFIKESPRKIGVMWPKIGDAEEWSKKQLMRELIEPNPMLAELVQDGRGRRQSYNTILNKSFPGGYMSIFGANVPGDLRRFKGNVLYADEIDAIKEEQTDEGDQLKQFSVRGSEYPETIEILSSYPSLKGHSNIDDEYAQSDRRVWRVPCLACGFDEWVMHRKDLRYDPESPQDARLECPNCRELHDDEARIEMSRKPEGWFRTANYNGIAGFHCNALLWPHTINKRKFPGGFLQMLALEEISAEKAENPERERRVIINTRDAESYEAQVDYKPDHSVLFMRREEYNPQVMLPAGVLAIFFFVDLQIDRLELFIDGYGANNQIWALDYRVIRGTPLAPPDKGCWAELDRILSMTTYQHPCGKYIPIQAGLIDCGYKPDSVFAFTRPRWKQRIYASRGATTLGKPIVQRRPKREGNPWARVWEIGTNEAKDIIYQRLDLDNPYANGYQHFPKLGQFSEYYFQMLVAEDSEMKKAHDGKFYRFFSCDNGVRNEALDGRVGTMATERIVKPNYAKLAEEYAVSDGQSAAAEAQKEALLLGKEEHVKKPEQQHRRFVHPLVRRNKNFVGGWR